MSNIHNDLFAAVRLGSKNFKQVLELLAKTQWTNKDHVDAIKVTYQLGFYAGLAGNCTRAQAEGVFKLKPAKDGGDDKHRTLEQHRNVRCAISAWSHIALRAGMPNARTGKVRPAKQPVAAAPATPAPSTIKSVIVPKAKTQDDVRSFALEVATLMRKFENANAKASFGDYRMVFDSFYDQVSKLANPVDVVGSLVVVERAKAA
jgi:hypothetical protein